MVDDLLPDSAGLEYLFHLVEIVGIYGIGYLLVFSIEYSPLSLIFILFLFEISYTGMMASAFIFVE